MSHRVAAFVARVEVLRAGTAHLPHARVAPLAQGFGLLPLTADLLDEIGETAAEGEEVLVYLTPGAARLARALSASGGVAYVETDYFGGSGEQGAAAWVGGEGVMEPRRARLGTVNEALRRIGIAAGAGVDEFDAAGLHRHRGTDDWWEAAEADGG